MVSRLLRGGAQRRHLASAKWLSHLAKANSLRTRKLVYKFLRILHTVSQRPGELDSEGGDLASDNKSIFDLSQKGVGCV